MAGFATVCWLGDPDAAAPDLGRMVYRAEARPDRRGRVVFDRRARAWLAVAVPAEFEAVVMAAPTGGVLVVPVEDYTRRAKVVDRLVNEEALARDDWYRLVEPEANCLDSQITRATVEVTRLESEQRFRR